MSQVDVERRPLYWRMVVKAEEGARFSLIEDLSSAGARHRRLHERRRRALRRPGGEARVRLAPEPVRETWHFGRHKALLERDTELDWVPAASARSAARCGSRTTSSATARPRASPARTSPTATSISTTTRSRSTSRPNSESDFAFKGALRERRDRGLARDDPRRRGRAEDERVPGEPQPAALERRRTRTRSRASRSWRTTCAARTVRPRPDRPRRALLSDGARSDARKRPSA